MVAKKNRNTKSSEQLLASMAEILSKHHVLNDGKFLDNVLSFPSDVSKCGLPFDFTIFDTFGSDSDVFLLNGNMELSRKALAQIIFITHLEQYSKLYHYHLSGLDFIKLVFAYINISDTNIIEAKDLSDFYGFVLSHRVDGEYIYKRISAPSYQKITGSVISLNAIKRILSVYDIQGLIGNFTDKQENQALNEACLSQLDMTLADYQTGGSFNYIGLDVGRYYIDHCGNLFEAHFQYAVSARMAMQDTITQVQSKLGFGTLETIQPIVANALMGVGLSDISEYTQSIWSLDNLFYIYETAIENFISHYNSYADISCAFRLDTVNKIISRSKLPERYDTQEFVRSIIFTLCLSDKVKSGYDIFTEYFSALRVSNEAPNISYEAFIGICSDVISSNRDLLSGNIGAAIMLCEYHANRLCMHSSEQGVNRFKAGLNLVGSAGSTLVVGLLGWRKSEFGFSLSNVRITKNLDILDNLYTPFRFEIKWIVPKTSGETEVDREITLYTYLLLHLLDKFNLSNRVLPVLYQASKARNKDEAPSKNSASYMSGIVDNAWIDFILNYEGFDRHEGDLALLGEKLREELPKYILCQTNNTSALRARLTEYVRGTLDPKYRQILDEALSPDMRDKLVGSNVNVSPSEISKIRHAVLHDVVYPTPHGLRHVWAEAVLRRYRGDIGKFIRANFKHLDESFFMAYLRNKETQAVYSVAKRTVINSIVRQQIQALAGKDHAYIGGFGRSISKMISLTKVLTQEEYETLASTLVSKRVINITAMPWSTCVPRVGAIKYAKCAVDGVIQPQNAEPKFCLGCINGDICEGNYNGIVVYIKADIAACRNPNLPKSFKSVHITTVKLALARVKELLKNDRTNKKYLLFIDFLKETLELAEK